MDENRAGRLSEFLTNLHFSNKDKIQSKQALAKYSNIAESPRAKAVCSINYSTKNRSTLKGELFRFFLQPSGRTPVLIIQMDEKHDWLRLIRFVSKGDQDFNAETISLTGKGVSGFNGFGYRYEHPEDEGDEHNFFHIQPILETDAAEVIPGIPQWLPYRFPTFYMHANDSYELGVYAISSLCGWRDLVKYQATAYEDCWLLNHLISKGREAAGRNTQR